MRALPPSPSRTKIVGDGVPDGWITHLPRRAGPACPAEKCVPGGGTHGSRPTGAYPPKKTTRRPLRGAAPACQRTPAFATVSGEIFTFWIGAQNLVGNCCDFDEGICGRGTDSHTSDAGGQSRPPLQNGTAKTPSPTEMTTLSGGHFLRFYALVSEPARPRWGCWRPETHRCRCAWWWRRPC